jgi:Domain of unknown function (DUF4865)
LRRSCFASATYCVAAGSAGLLRTRTSLTAAGCERPFKTRWPGWCHGSPRCSTKGSGPVSFADAYPGLGVKAYLIREVGIDESAVNCYAPLYVWRSTEAAARFLWRGDGFGGIVRDFGRPSVWTWLGGRFQAGRHAGTTVPAAVHIQRRPLPAEVDPGQIATATDDLLDAATQNDGVHSAGYAIDPTTWNAIEIRLVAAGVPAEAGEVRTSCCTCPSPTCRSFPAEASKPRPGLADSSVHSVPAQIRVQAQL